MNDAIDDVMGDEEDEEESDNILSQVPLKKKMEIKQFECVNLFVRCVYMCV